MSSIDLLPLLMRWLHMLCAVSVIGSLLFYWFVMLPAAKQSFDGTIPENFRFNLMKKWKLYLHTSIILFFVSGLYYYLAVGRPMHPGDSTYNMLFGIKFLLALVVFALYIILTSTMRWSEKLRDKAFLWRLLLILGIAVVFIGGAMRIR
jgi:uncharacterized membrane protein